MKAMGQNHESTGCAACAPPAQGADASPLHTIDLLGAAAMLGAHPETVRLKAKAGALPGRKVGKRWMFSTVALQRYLAGEWLPRGAQGDQQEEVEPCRSTNAKPARTGNTSCTPLAAERRYREALAPATKSRPRNSTTA
ncbi:DNA-binding protein [Burkholderia stagnalis]|uniref:DNA-binding protein n=2 Tax=Burkholderia stagnalis TaxID=1503054 RepID=A0ABX9YV64_9BURK|nr:DNA-binding protein [Burkholderia stagnalis]RQQ70493.1 DNA-binding protein [Burkholderia stagnalis]RQQ71581.1 DNA-binding protein [Burkholderia stagnalis]RQQ83762.1 DNA-binding protein [Burkholderia stagnalis]RQQ92115.1 DNA-binding protein [Burkholderia stagnalis]